MSELTKKINNILHDNIDIWDENEGIDLKNLAAEIAAMIEERKPDTITVPEAVSRLAEWAINRTHVYKMTFSGYSWSIGGIDDEDWVKAIINGNCTAEAYRVGLEDLFVTILGDES